MTKKYGSPWSKIEIPKELEKEHRAELAANLRKRKKIENQMKKFTTKSFDIIGDDRSPTKQLEEDGITYVDNTEDLLDVLTSILNKDKPKGK